MEVETNEGAGVNTLKGKETPWLLKKSGGQGRKGGLLVSDAWVNA